jgi:hypothetical protein
MRRTAIALRLLVLRYRSSWLKIPVSLVRFRPWALEKLKDPARLRFAGFFVSGAEIDPS